MTIDFSKYLFRCSSLGHIMTEPQGKTNAERYAEKLAQLREAKAKYDAIPVDKLKLKTSIALDEKIQKLSGEAKELEKDKDKVELSESCKVHLVDILVKEKYGRQTDISNKYIEKGLMVEEDSITLYSLVRRRFFKKNESHLSNAFIKGTPDLFEGDDIFNASNIIDVKSSWDIYTFFRTHTKKINPLYYWQLQGYMALAGANSSVLAYCLVNTPDIFLQEEERRLFYRMNAVTDQNPDYVEACEELKKSMVYDDIPLEERVIEIPIERNEADIARINKRVQDCRQYLFELQEKLAVNELIETE